MRMKLRSITLVLVLVFAIMAVLDMGFEVLENSSGRIITVGHYKMYSTIQSGINAANDGDTVMVYTEDYYETIVVDKSIDLVSVDAGIWGTFPGMPGMPLLDDNLVTITADYVNISGFDIWFSGHAGIEVWSNFNNICNNNIMETYAGSIIIHGDHNKVQSNSASDGVRLYNSQYNIIIDNALGVYDNRACILLENSNGNTIRGNTAWANAEGIHLLHSDSNGIIGNEFAKGPYSQYYDPEGIHLQFSNRNVIFGNEIRENERGIWFESSSNNSVHHNSIIDNIDQAYDDRHDNFWDDGYPSGGNYWSDYNGVDMFSGPNQDIPGGDGIGDTNYSIDADSIDHYPLMEPNNKTIAYAGSDQTAYPGLVVIFDGSGSYNPLYEITTYQWDFDDGSPYSYGCQVNHIYQNLGLYNVTLTVTDSMGINDTDNCIVSVIDPAPIANAGPDQEAYEGYQLEFTGIDSYDLYGCIINYTWNFNDGSPYGYGMNQTHRFSSRGVYNVVLTVTDDNGETDSDSCRICVLQSPTLLAYAGPDQKAGVGEVVEFSEGRGFYLNEHWEIETVDSEGDVGNYNSIAIDSGGKPHISYYNYVPPPDPPEPPCGDPLKYARWTGSEWFTQIVDDEGVVGSHTSIALNSFDKPCISYLDETNWRLKYAWKGSSRWYSEFVDSWPTGQHSSLAIDSNDYPHIAYDDDQQRAVKYACKTASGWITETVCKGTWVCLVLDSNDNPHISIIDIGVLKYARKNGSSWIIEVVDTGPCKEDGTSIALDKNDNPHISYFDDSFNLKYTRWEKDQWNFEIVHTSLGSSAESSLALDAYDNPHICYSRNGGLRYAEKIIDTWQIESVDWYVGYPGRTLSMVLDRNGNPHISYYDMIENDLKYAKEKESFFTYEWDFGDGSPHSSEKNPTHIYPTCGIFTVTLTVTDGGGHIDNDTCIIFIGYPLNLNFGWNLISLPNIQNDSDIHSVLRSIEGDYDALQWYDSSDRQDSWKHYHVSKPSRMNDLTEIDHEMGLWIHITVKGGTTLYVLGEGPVSSQSIDILSGWNLVGYPSDQSMTRNEALNTLFNGSDVDVIQYFDSTEGVLRTLEENELMHPGCGYWIHANSDCVWEVPL